MSESSTCGFFRKLLKTRKKYREKDLTVTSLEPPLFIDQDAREAHNPDISINVQASTPQRLESANHRTPGKGDEDKPDISARSRSPALAPSSPGPTIQREYVQNVQRNPAEGTSPTDVLPAALERCSVDRKDSVLQRLGEPAEASTMSILKQASNFNINNAHLYEIKGNVEINHLTDTNKWKRDQLFTILPHVQAGLEDYDTKKKISLCFKGTREALLRHMIDWVTGPDESRMYTLSGLAGIGKSTVAYTVASQADERGLLGASFFFSRDDADHRSAKKFFTTIAYHLCLFNGQFADAIAGALITKRGSAATTANPQEQLEALILDPLRTIPEQNTVQTLIVIDALDECDTADAPSVIFGLRQLVHTLPSFKVILTSRPQPLLDNVFAIQAGYKIFRLHNIEDKIVNDDIRLYLKHCLSPEQVRERLGDPSQDWFASDSQIESLVRAAGRLFIIAAMAVRFILDELSPDPAGRIEKLLRAFAQSHTPFDNLDDFYTIILRKAVPVATLLEERYQADCRDTGLTERYQAVVGAIVLIPVPLSINTLAALLGVDVKQVLIVLRQLQSIIFVGSDDIPTVYHQSLVDYITDSQRCRDIRLRISPRIRHTWIAMRCFETMGKYLKYNILGLGIPARFMSNEDGMAKDKISDEKLQAMIPMELQFACVYWVEHFNGSNTDDEDLMKEFQKFAWLHALHWFETLSLIGKLDSASRAMRISTKLVTSSNLRQLLSDGLRFISKFYETIKRSALHTYFSALTFTPTGSVLYQCYANRDIYDICKVSGVPDKWDPIIAYLDHGECVEHVQFSLDNTMLASWSKKSDKPLPFRRRIDKGTLKVWDAATGTPISIVRGNDFAIADDFSTIVSLKDSTTITLYNANGRKEDATFTTRAEIFQVVISSESRRIAAGLSDGTVCLWDSGNGEQIGSYERDANKQNSLRFSVTGTRLAYFSANNVVKLRDGINGGCIADLDCGSKAFVFSRDGSRIATRSKSGVQLWNSRDGQLVGNAEAVDCPKPWLAISSNGSVLATTDSSKVTLWDGNGGNPMPLLRVLDLESSHCMAFSADDDTFATCTQKGIRIYSLKSRSFISTLSPCECFYNPSFSPDCSRLATGNRRGTVCLYDMQNVKTSDPPNKQRDFWPPATALALSPDCSRIACGFGNGTIELWQISGISKQLIATSSDPHKGITAIRFSPDGRRFASGLRQGTPKLWDGETGALCGKLSCLGDLYLQSYVYTLEFSNSFLAAATDHAILLWDPQTLKCVHSFAGSFRMLSANGDLLAACNQTDSRYGTPSALNISIFDVTKHTKIASFFPGQYIHTMAFLSDTNSQLVAQFYNGDIVAFDLASKEVVKGPAKEDFIQLCSNLPLWNGHPVRVANYNPELVGALHCCVEVLFSPYDGPVPMLWIPKELHVRKWTQGRSMIALGCDDGGVVLLQLSVNRVM